MSRDRRRQLTIAQSAAAAKDERRTSPRKESAPSTAANAPGLERLDSIRIPSSWRAASGFGAGKFIPRLGGVGRRFKDSGL